MSVDAQSPRQKALTLFANAQFSEAIKILEASMQQDDESAGHLKIISACHHEMGNFDLAISTGKSALKYNLEDADIYNNIGSAYLYKKDNKTAVDFFRKSLDKNPAHLSALNNISKALLESENPKDAKSFLKQAIKVAENDFSALLNTGLYNMKMGYYEDAEYYLARASKIEPNSFHALSNLSTCMLKRHDYTGAITTIEKALTIAPAESSLYYNKALILEQANRPDAAHAQLLHAYKLQPEDAEVLTALSRSYRKIGYWHKALTFARKAASIQSNNRKHTMNYGSLLAESGDFLSADLILNNDDFYSSLRMQGEPNLLFTLNYHPEKTPKAIFRNYLRYASNNLSGRELNAQHSNQATTNRKLRVGYISPDFRHHACRYFIEPIIENHNKDAFELYAYSNLEHHDEHTEHFKNLFNHWRDIVRMSATEVANAILNDRIDILIDLAGHTAGNRLAVLAARPAPIQMTYLGYGYTTGLTQVDYFISDKRFTPIESENLFTEDLLYLDNVAFCYMPPDKQNTTLAEPPFKKNGYVTFGSLSRTIRLNNKVLETWAEILRLVPNSRLRLDQKIFAQPDACEWFMKRLEQIGVAIERVDLVCSDDYMQGYNKIDISLDAFPHNGGTTIFESLWMGVPVLSKQDRAPLGCFGKGILQPLGLEPWIAENIEEYITKAIYFAKNTHILENLRQQLRQRMLSSDFMNYKQVTTDLENKLQEVAKKHLS